MSERTELEVATAIAMARGWLRKPEHFSAISKAIKSDLRREARAAIAATSGLVMDAVRDERERCASLCRQQADLSRGDHLVPEACMEIEEAIYEGWVELESEK